MPRTSRFVISVVLSAATLATALPMRLAMGQERPILLKAATVLDGKGQVVRNTTIVVEGTKITRIGGPAPQGAITYDLTGLTGTPGWIDTHSHLWWHFANGRLAGRDAPSVKAMLHAVGNAALKRDAGCTSIP